MSRPALGVDDRRGCRSSRRPSPRRRRARARRRARRRRRAAAARRRAWRCETRLPSPGPVMSKRHSGRPLCGVEGGHQSGPAVLARDADDREPLIGMQAVAHAGDPDEYAPLVDQRRGADADAGRAVGADPRQRIVAVQLARRLGRAGVFGDGHVPQHGGRSRHRARSAGRPRCRDRPCPRPPRRRGWPGRSTACAPGRAGGACSASARGRWRRRARPRGCVAARRT